MVFRDGYNRDSEGMKKDRYMDIEIYNKVGIGWIKFFVGEIIVF